MGGKLDLKACRTCFSGKYCFGGLRSLKFQRSFEALNFHVCGKIFLMKFPNSEYHSAHQEISNKEKIG